MLCVASLTLVFVRPSHRNIREEKKRKDKYLRQSEPAIMNYVELIVGYVSEQAAMDAMDKASPDQ